MVTHPYGTETFADVTSGVGNRDIVFTEDIGITPGDFTDALPSRVGPFIQHVEDTLIDPATNRPFVPLRGARRPAARPPLRPGAGGFVAGVSRHFIGDGVTPRFITGSPYGTNCFELCGPFDGPGITPSRNQPFPDRCIRQALFTLTGMLSRPQHRHGQPALGQRATYDRNDGGTRVDVMARASRSPGQANPRRSSPPPGSRSRRC